MCFTGTSRIRRPRGQLPLLTPKWPPGTQHLTGELQCPGSPGTVLGKVGVPIESLQLPGWGLGAGGWRWRWDPFLSSILHLVLPTSSQTLYFPWHTPCP